MTKTLTEQWREGTLPEGLYYIKGKGNYDIALIRNRYCPVLTSPYCEDDVFESEFVPVDYVPSYDEYRELLDLNVYEKDRKKVMVLEDKVKRLQKQLEIATKALKEYEDKQNWDIRGVSFMKYNKGFTIARKALKEMEGVK